MKRLGLVRWGGMAVTIVTAVSCTVDSTARKPTSADVLGMVGEAFRKSPSMEYPPMESVGAFWPDLKEVLPYCADPQLVRDYVTGRSGVRVCYFAFAAPSSSVAMEFLGAYEADPSVQLTKRLSRKFFIRSSPDGRVYADMEFWQFFSYKGLGRFFIYDIGNPAAMDKYERHLPVMWEMPHGRDPSDTGGWVLYANGTVRWVPYPSDYPMTRPVIERVQRLMKPVEPGIKPGVEPGNRKARQVDAHPPAENERGRAWQSPVYELAVQIADHLPMDFCKIAQCDETPSVSMGGGMGYRIEFTADTWIKPLKRTFVLLPDEYAPGGGSSAWGSGEVTYYLGRGCGYHWFAPNPPYAVIRELQEAFGLTGADDLVKTLQKLLPSIDPQYRYEALFALANEGPSALPVLEENFQSCNKADVLAAMEKIGEPEAERFSNSVFAGDNPQAFKNATDFVYGMDEARNHLLRASDSLVEAAKRAIVSCNDYQLMAEHAIRLAFLFRPKGSGTEFTELGLQLLDRLPEAMRQKVLAEAAAKYPRFEERLDWIRSRVAKRNEMR